MPFILFGDFFCCHQVFWSSSFALSISLESLFTCITEDVETVVIIAHHSKVTSAFIKLLDLHCSGVDKQLNVFSRLLDTLLSLFGPCALNCADRHRLGPVIDLRINAVPAQVQTRELVVCIDKGHWIVAFIIVVGAPTVFLLIWFTFASSMWNCYMFWKPSEMIHNNSVTLHPRWSANLQWCHSWTILCSVFPANVSSWQDCILVDPR